MASINWGEYQEDDERNRFPPRPVDRAPFTFPDTQVPQAPAPDALMADPTYAAQTEARNAWSNRNQGTIAPLPVLQPPARPPTQPQAPPAGGGGNLAADYQRATAGLTANERDQGSLNEVATRLRGMGYDVSLPQTDEQGRNQGLVINGKLHRVIDSSNNWTLVEGSGAWGAEPSSYAAQFNDQSTRLLEQYLTQQMSALSAQQAAQEQANAGLRGRMPEIQAATDRLVKYLNERATSLQGAPYTGTEQEILRTQMLEPIERDRTAANQRALQQIGGRGLTPESGISQELMNQVNSVFDRARAGAQGDLAYRTVNEQRSRQQEAQQLLGLVPQVQRAGATGDLALLQALDAAVNQPAQQAIGLATANQRLPSMAMDDALRVMGLGGSSPDSVFQQAMGLYGAQNQQNQQGLDWWQMLGSALPYLLGQGAR